jgi:putative cell wall-binding protein
MRRILMLLTTMALALLMSAEVALAATYTIVSTSRNDYIFAVVSNRLSGDVININCREGYDTVRVTVDSGDTVNFDGCENTAISYR